MTNVREQDRPATVQRPRNPAKAAQNPSASGHVLVRADQDVTEVPVSRQRYEGIVRNSRTLGKVIAGYADTAAKARRTGRSYVVSYVVTPDGKAEAMAERLADAPADDLLDGALARARSRGATRIVDILKGADMLTARDFGPLIGASHETVNIRRKRHEILGLQGATRGLRYPRWQVTDAGLPLPGLSELFQILGGQPWTVYRFLRTAHAELGGRTALEALKAGQVEAVLGAAQNQSSGAFS